MDITPTWSAALDILLTNHKRDPKAYSELQKMAKLADAYVARLREDQNIEEEAKAYAKR